MTSEALIDDVIATGNYHYRVQRPRFSIWAKFHAEITINCQFTQNLSPKMLDYISDLDHIS